MLQGVDDTTDPRAAPDRSGTGRDTAKWAATSTSEPFEGMDSGAVPVAPDHPDPVRPDQRDRDRPHIGRDPARIEQGPPAHLLDAGGAGTRKTELAGGMNDEGARISDPRPFASSRP